MAKRLIQYLNIVMAGLVTGTVFGIWLGYNPADWSAPTYVEQQQSAIKALNTLMPILGLITIILTFTTAFMQKKTKHLFYTLLVAGVFFIVSGIVTKFGNQPINAVVITWDMNKAPDNWTELRDKWWMYHIIRTAASFIGFLLVSWTATSKQTVQ